MRTAGSELSGGAPLPSYMNPNPAPPVTQPPAPSLPPPTPPPTHAPITIGGDPNAWLQGDAGYQALLSSLHGNEDAFGATMKSQIQRDALQSGYNIPQLAPYLDAGMAGQITSDPNSAAAVSSETHANNLRAIQNQLAARGAYDSGELTYGIGNESERYNREGLSQRGALLDQINSLLGQQASMQGSDQAQLATELGNAAGRQATLHPVTTANYDASTGGYVDQYGNHFNADGTPFASTASAPATPAPAAALAPDLQTGAQAVASGGPYSWGIGGKQ